MSFGMGLNVNGGGIGFGVEIGPGLVIGPNLNDDSSNSSPPPPLINWKEEGVARLRSTLVDSDENDDRTKGRNESDGRVASALTLDEAREVRQVLGKARVALEDPEQRADAQKVLDQADTLLTRWKSQWQQFDRGRWTSVFSPSDRKITKVTGIIDEAHRSILELRAALSRK